MHSNRDLATDSPSFCSSRLLRKGKKAPKRKCQNWEKVKLTFENSNSRPYARLIVSDTDGRGTEKNKERKKKSCADLVRGLWRVVSYLNAIPIGMDLPEAMNRSRMIRLHQTHPEWDQFRSG